MEEKNNYEVWAHYYRTPASQRKYNIFGNEVSAFYTKKAKKLFYTRIDKPEITKPMKVPHGSLSLTREIVRFPEVTKSEKIKKEILKYLNITHAELLQWFGHSHTEESEFSKHWNGEKTSLSDKIVAYGGTCGARFIRVKF